jgi:hypothetical protein
VLVLAVSGSGCCSCYWQTVRAGSEDYPRGADQPAVRHVLREFLHRVVSIRRVGCFRLE